jgi:hypothetical protein
MNASVQRILLGASMAASTIAIAATGSFAATLKPTNIQFTTNGVANTPGNPPNINTWTYAPGAPVFDNTGIGGVNRRVLNDFNNYGNTDKAASALTDNDSATNVELWTRGETVGANVGFNANLGTNTIKVESVTKPDWADGVLATAWLNGFRNAYGTLMQGIGTPELNLLAQFNANFSNLVTYLSSNGFGPAGDPNVGDVAYDTETGQLKIDLVGHLDATGRYVDTRPTIVRGGTTIVNPDLGTGRSPDYARNSTGNPLFDGILFAIAKEAYRTKTSLAISEIAKVTFNDKTDYAFAFKATDSGAIAGDRNKQSDFTSYTGIYTWTTKSDKPPIQPPGKSVPEPSTLLGLIAISGLLVTQRKLRQQ